MLRYDADDWRKAKKKEIVRFPAGRRAQYHIETSCPDLVVLSGITQSGTVVDLIRGTHLNIKPRFDNFDEIQLACDGGDFAYRVRRIERQDGEELSDERPAAPPMPGNSLLRQVRDLIRRERGDPGPRHKLLDPEELPGARRYEVDEEDDLFEEELIDQAVAERNAAASSSSSQQIPNPETSGSSSVAPNPSTSSAGGTGAQAER